MVGCWVGSSVEEGVRHSSGESGEESPEDEEDGDEPGDGSDDAAATCEREVSTVETSDVADTTAVVAAAAGPPAAETTTGGTPTLATHCGGTAGQSLPYSFLTRCEKASNSAASTWRIHSRYEHISRSIWLTSLSV